MADERDFELLDDYLTNRLSAQDRSVFEQKLKADPDLQHEYALQRRLIQGIKDARVAQLKSMLNQVPVPSAATGNAIATKVILGTLVTLIIAAAAFWYYRDEPAKVEHAIVPSTQQQQKQQDNAGAEKQAVLKAKPDLKKPEQSVVKDRVQEIDKNQTSAGTEHSRPSLAKKPDPVSAPVARNDNEGNRSEAAVSVVRNEAYSFHYRFENGALTLFGPFDNGTFDVIEVSDAGKNIHSLYYKDKYYLLDDSSDEIRSLAAITDASLIQKLEKQRVSK